MIKKLVVISMIGFAACSGPNSHSENTERALDAEAREDSLELVAAYEAQALIDHVVNPVVETVSVRAQTDDDAADDPAIWIHPDNSSESVVYGTNKKGGLIAFDLDGNELYYLERGKINNADVLQNVELEDQNYDLLCFSNRTIQAFEIIPIDKVGGLDTSRALIINMDTTIMDDIYGVCFGRAKDGSAYAFANAKNGHFQQYQISSEGSELSAQLVRELQFEDQPEGMVSDAKNGKLYVGLENSGIVKLDLNPEDTTITQLAQTNEKHNSKLRFDLEGIAIMRSGTNDYLVVSSQGNFSYAVFDINDNDNYVGSFKVMANGQIDGVEETDGIEIYSDSLSESFPTGIFLAQDGFNYSGDTMSSQNFKYVDLRSILSLEFIK